MSPIANGHEYEFKSGGDGIEVAIAQVPVTGKRIPFIQTDDRGYLQQAGVARANIAASVHAPHGTESGNWTGRYRDQTVLQQHCAFFDVDNDGVIWPLDTYRGFRRLGFNLLLSVIALLVIHLNFSYPTLSPGTVIPDPFCRVYTARIHKDKHGSDSGAYDNEGRFIPQKFEDIFAKYADGDGDEQDGLTLLEVLNLMRGQRLVWDIFGWCGFVFEWGITYVLLWPEDGRMRKDDIRRVFDGSIFYDIAAKREERRHKKHIQFL